MNEVLALTCYVFEDSQHERRHACHNSAHRRAPKPARTIDCAACVVGNTPPTLPLSLSAIQSLKRTHTATHTPRYATPPHATPSRYQPYSSPASTLPPLSTQSTLVKVKIVSILLHMLHSPSPNSNPSGKSPHNTLNYLLHNSPQSRPPLQHSNPPLPLTLSI